MDTTKQTWLFASMRAIVVAVASILAGYGLYRSWVFEPTMVPFQFTFSGVTAGLAYASSQLPKARPGLASLVVWFVVVTWLIEPFNPWLLTLNSTYILAITGAIFIFSSLRRRSVVKSAMARIALAGALFSLVNSLIIILLVGLSGHIQSMPIASLGEIALKNAQYGALIGLAVGIGIEIAEFSISKLSTMGFRHADTTLEK